MRMKKQWLCLALIIILIVIVIAGQGVKNADDTTDYGETQLYTEDEFQQAMKVIQKRFVGESIHWHFTTTFNVQRGVH